MSNHKTRIQQLEKTQADENPRRTNDEIRVGLQYWQHIFADPAERVKTKDQAIHNPNRATQRAARILELIEIAEARAGYILG